MSDLVLLGIDTGGTYTDAVIVTDDPVPQVLAAAKAPTSHHDLSLGVTEAMAAVTADLDVTRIGLVSISTTLATNAIVEGHGGRVCLVTMGFGADDLARGGLTDALRDGVAISIAGGHTSHGDALETLDLAALDTELDNVDLAQLAGFAVVGQFAVRNPDHEVAVRKHIRARCALGVTCSHELSANLDGPKRAVTAVLNARLVDLIGDLVTATRSSMADRGLEAPLMVVRGDGSLMAAELAVERPIETILSGPAASVIGARHLAKLTAASGAAGSIDRAIVSDIGGTTTDIAVVVDGEVQISATGASVGGHDTMVEAIDIHTIGLGGDSEVWIDDVDHTTALRLGPRRVVPVAVLASLHPEIVHAALTRQQAATTTAHLAGRFALLRTNSGEGDARSDYERSVLQRLVDGPAPLSGLLPTKRHEIALDNLVRTGIVARSGFTPTDAAHVLGLHQDFDALAAEHAAALFARTQDRRGAAVATSALEVATRTVAELERRTGDAVLQAALGADCLDASPSNPLLKAGLDRHRGHVHVDLRLGSPLIGLGASAATYYPGVADRLGTTVALSEHAGVANAIGAIVGTIRVRKHSTITRKKNGTYVATGDHFAALDDAVEATVALLSDEVRDVADRAGAATVDLEVDRVDNVVSIAGQDFFVDATITVTGSGRPLRRS